MSNEIVKKDTYLGVVNNIDKMMEYAKVLIKSGFLPEHIRTPEQVVAIMAKARELNIPEMQALSSVSIIRGVPVLSGQLMMALIRRSGLLEDFKIDWDIQGNCSVTMKRKDCTPITMSFTWDDAKSLGLIEKDNYIKQPRTMFMWRAIARCARVTFPDIIAGVYVTEEMDDIAEEIPLNITSKEDESKISDYVKQRITNYKDYLAIDLQDYETLSKKIAEAKTKEELMKIATIIKTEYIFLDKNILSKLRQEFIERSKEFYEYDSSQLNETT